MQIRLEPWDDSRKQDLIDLCNGADRTYLTNRLPYPYTEADADWWLGKVREHDGKDGVFRAVVVDGKAVGNITVEGKTDVYCKDAELGYILATPYWDQGIMTEATKEICTLAFQTLDLARITAEVYAPNKASQRVLEKNSFVLEGQKKNAVFKNGALWDLYIYGLLKPEGNAHD